MSSTESTATPQRPTSPSACGESESWPIERRHVEGDRESHLALLEQEPVALVGVLRAAEAGELAHRPDLVAVHGPVDAAGVRDTTPARRGRARRRWPSCRGRTRSRAADRRACPGGSAAPRAGAASRARRAALPPGRSSGSLLRGFPAVPVEDAFGEGVRVHPAQIAFELSNSLSPHGAHFARARRRARPRSPRPRPEDGRSGAARAPRMRRSCRRGDRSPRPARRPPHRSRRRW